MLNYLQDITGSTPIASLPSVIKHNNLAISDEFAWLYDSSTDRITRSVYAPTGSVKSHFGEFVNLSAEYITIKNTDSLLDTIQDAVSSMSHNSLDKCWSSDIVKSAYTKDTSEILCHDASVIAYNDENVYQAINRIDSNISDIQNTLNIYLSTNTATSENPSGCSYYGAASNKSESSDTEQQASTYAQYPISYISATSTQLHRKGISELHIKDLISYKQRYNYYTIANMQVDLNDKANAAIDTLHTNIIIDINFIDCMANDYYTILLDRESKQYVQMSKNILNRLQLKSVSWSSTYGTKWKVYNYSVVSKDDIKLINL